MASYKVIDVECVEQARDNHETVVANLACGHRVQVRVLDPRLDSGELECPERHEAQGVA